MGMTKGQALESTSHRTPSRTPMTEAGPPHRICSQGSAAVASPPDASWAATPPDKDAIRRTWMDQNAHQCPGVLILSESLPCILDSQGHAGPS